MITNSPFGSTSTLLDFVVIKTQLFSIFTAHCLSTCTRLPRPNRRTKGKSARIFRDNSGARAIVHVRDHARRGTSFGFDENFASYSTSTHGHICLLCNALVRLGGRWWYPGLLVVLFQSCCVGGVLL